jgi:cyclopropane fatty-acyl-phospholipid synthase-like methyltransferase
MEYWHKEFYYAQDRISDIPGNDYYANEYRYHEPWYSTPIIQWLYEDSVNNTHKINNILDIGCGWGAMALYSQRMYDANVYCIDMEKRDIPLDNIIFGQLNIENSDIPYNWPGYFDKIIMTELLEHLNACPIPTLEKVCNRLNEGGMLYLSTPNSCDPLWGRLTKYYNHVGEMPNPDSSIKFTDEHIYQYSEGELLYILDKAGFLILEKEIFHPSFWGSHICIKAIKK